MTMRIWLLLFFFCKEFRFNNGLCLPKIYAASTVQIDHSSGSKYFPQCLKIY